MLTGQLPPTPCGVPGPLQAGPTQSLRPGSRFSRIHLRSSHSPRKDVRGTGQEAPVNLERTFSSGLETALVFTGCRFPAINTPQDLPAWCFPEPLCLPVSCSSVCKMDRPAVPCWS